MSDQSKEKLSLNEASIYVRKHKNTIRNHIKNEKLICEYHKIDGVKMTFIDKGELDRVYNNVEQVVAHNFVQPTKKCGSPTNRGEGEL